MKSAGNPSGFVLHRGTVGKGPFAAGEPFVAVATLETDNRKTGDMIQVWFLLERINPVAAVAQRIDARTICRGCPFAKASDDVADFAMLGKEELRPARAALEKKNDSI